MITRPLLKPWLRVTDDGDRHLFETDGALTVLDGAGVALLLPRMLALLDGRPRQEILAAFDDELHQPVENLLDVLQEEQLLIEAPFAEASSDANRASLMFLAATSARPELDVADLPREQVVVIGNGPRADRVERELAATDAFKIARSGWDQIDSSLAVVVPGVEELGELTGWNRRALHHDLRWMLTLPFDGRSWMVGPIFIPQDTCCYECMRTRRAVNTEYAEDAARAREGRSRMPDDGPAEAVVAGLVSAFALRWLALRDSFLPGVAYTLSFTPRVQIDAHDIIRVPRCQECSDSAGDATLSPWFVADA